MTARRSHTAARLLWSRTGAAACAVVTGLAVSLMGAAPAGAAQYLGDQWGLTVIGAPTAWQYGTGSGVKIGIVDTGVDLTQQDLQGKVVAAQDFLTSPSCTPPAAQGQDDNGHGTHVAGIAAATGAVGVSGVAPGASLVVAKVLDCQGSGEYQDVVSGINWAVSEHAQVINLSLGDASIGGVLDPSNLEGSPLASALQNAWAHGAIPVIAAGNNSNGALGLGDANYSGLPAVVVAATGSPSNGEQASLASYSNGVNEAQWGVAAPGGDDPAGPTSPACGAYDPYEILSTYWTSANPTSCYASDEGTSMATPFVSGALALLLGRGLSPTQAVQTLLSTANHSVSCGSDCSGLINVAAAMESTGSPSHPTSAGTSSSSPTTTTTRTASPTTTHPTTTATSPTTSSTTAGRTTTSPPRAGSLGLHGATASASHSSGWWLLLPILVGLGAAGALATVGYRRRLHRSAP